MIENSHVKYKPTVFEPELNQWIRIIMHAEVGCNECLLNIRVLEPERWKRMTHWKDKK